MTLRVTDVARSTEFYANALGFDVQRERPGFALMNAYGTPIVLVDAETPEGDSFNPFRVGLDHFALGVENDALEGLVAMLDEAGARNNGIQVFKGSGALYISVYDPDGIAWEFFGKPPD